MLERRFRMITLISILSAILLVFAGCSQTSETTDSKKESKGETSIENEKKELNIGLNADPPSLDPYASSALVDRMVHNSIYDKLFDLNEKGEIVPMLVDSYDVSEDGTSYTFTLKEGVKFHDGTDFNAEAVKFNFERNTSENSKRRGELKFVDSITVEDALTVKITLKEPFAPFISILTDRSGMMVSPAGVEKYGDDDFRNNPVGTGPYVFEEHKKGDHITLKKNENYWNGEVKIDELNFRVFSNGTAAVQNLRSGQLDIIDGVPVKEIPTVEKDDKLSVIAEAGMGYQGFYMNTTKEPFTNKYLRQAVDRAIDREAVVNVLFDGYGLPANSPFAPGNLAYGDSDKVSKPDEVEIKKLLEKGGNPDGFTFTMQIGTSPANEQFGAVLQSMLGKHNINVELEKVEFGTMLDNGDTGNFQALQLGWSGRPDPDQSFYDFVVTDMPNNDSRISNEELDKVATEARTELDTAKRKQLYDRAMEIMHDEAGYAYIYHSYVIFGMSKDIKGFTYVPDGIIRTAHLDK
jgi:peptide/nickel transport system substrate-binding protein